MNGIATILLACMLCVVTTNRNKTTHDNRLQVYGGKTVEEGEFPFYARIKEKPKTRFGQLSHICGGSIIETNIILTAAHCVTENYNGDSDQVKIDDPSELRVIIDQKVLHIKNIIVHENYEKKDYNNDIALIILRNSLIFTTTVKKIALPSGSDEDIASFYDAGKPITVIGYGYTRQNGLAEKLQKLDQTIIRSDSCGGQINQTGMICSGNVGRMIKYRAAGGDSGGPLFTKQKDRSFVQLALVSWGITNITNTTYDISTKVSTYVPWIKHKTERLNENNNFIINNPGKWKKYELNQKLEVGDVIVAKGIFSRSSGKFSVNICRSNDDIILRVVFIPKSKKLKFNSYKNGRWQHEIRHKLDDNSFQDNTPFTFTIKVYDREYKIFLNDRELNKKFSHRQDIKTATHVYVAGRINWSSLEIPSGSVLKPTATPVTTSYPEYR